MADLFTPLTLPNGKIIPNRLCKAAMEENMADSGQIPGEGLINLYKQWAEGGVGLILTGNVMIAPDALTGPGGVVLEEGTLEKPGVRDWFERWAKSGKSGGGQLWMQISHPGRQVYATQGTEPVSASATKVATPGLEKMFATARALSGDEIYAMINRYADSASLAESVGFDGVQIHAAHGYLVAQFLSPLTNLREDEWGGSLENRARFLLEIVRAVRARVSPDFCVAVKLNSADFQRGGFDVEDASQVVEWLNEEAVDLVEISGGNYESAAMMGMPDDDRFTSTQAREMYFVDFAKDIAKSAKMPLMATGGVTRKETAEAALDEGLDMVGLARAFGFAPQLPVDWQNGLNDQVKMPKIKSKNKIVRALGGMGLTKQQLYRMGEGKTPKTNQNVYLAIVKTQLKTMQQTKRYKKWLAQEG